MYKTIANTLRCVRSMKHTSHLCLLAGLLLASLPALAQSKVTGHVTDPHGAAVDGARVELFNLGSTSNINLATLTAKTDAAGNYAFTDLHEGRYRVTVLAKGFEPNTEEEFILTTEGTEVQDVELKSALHKSR